MKTLHTLSLLLLAGVTIFQSPTVATAQEEPDGPTYEDPNYKEDAHNIAPPALVKDFIEAVKNSEFFKTANVITPSDIEEMLPQWNLVNPAGFQISKMSLLMHMIDMGMPFKVGDTHWELAGDDIDAPNDTYRTVFMLVHEEHNFEYEVKPKDLKELNFDILDLIEIRHPLSRVLSKHEVSNQTLTDVVAGLCREANVGYSIRADIADTLRISQRLTNRSIYECLKMAAGTASWMVRIDEGGRSSEFRGDPSVDFRDVFETYTNREWINAMERLEKPIISQADALDYLVRRESRWLRTNGTIVMVNKPDESKKDK